MNLDKMDSWMDAKDKDKESAEKTRRTSDPKYATTIEDAEKAREERIAARRERVAAKTAAENKPDGEEEVESVASSVELLSSHRQQREQHQIKPTRGFRRSTAVGPPVSASTASFAAKAAASSAAKLHAALKPSSAHLASAAATEAKDHLEMSLEQCRKQLEQLLLDGETLVTNVKVAAEYRERARQDTVLQTKKDRLARLREEAKECEEAYKEIEAQWFINAEKVLPLELYETIQKQQQDCDKLLDKKQDLIEDMQEEMETNDVEYENDLEIYEKDMMLLGDRIDDHIDTLRTAFMEELQLVEEFASRDRDILLEQNQKEWMDLLDKFEALNKSATGDRQKGALDRFTKRGELYSSVREEANKMKEKLKDDFRALQLELEHIKMASLVNMEKLEYNLEVLHRREIENLAMKNSMKRYLLKMQDKFNAKVKEYKNIIGKAHRDNEKIIRDIRRLESINSDAKKKTMHLLALDFQTYTDLWAFNEEEAREKLGRLRNSEKLIFETQFGLKLLDPDMSPLNERPPEIDQYVKRFVIRQKQLRGECVEEEQADGHGEAAPVAKVERFVYPDKGDVSDYWDRFQALMDPKKVDWNSVMYCLAEYNKLLKVRNQFILDVNSLYQENMELSFLLKKHLQGQARQCFGPQIANSPPFC